MKKLIAVAIVAVVLTGCEYGETTNDFKLPNDLKDCKVYTVEGKTKDLTIIRCPSSNTTVRYSYGKNIHRTITTMEM